MIRTFLLILALIQHLFVNGQIIETFAGNGSALVSGGDGGPASNAPLYYPNDVAVDKFGNVFVANSYGQRIKKINSSGIISTFAGGGTMTYYDGAPADSVGMSRVLCVTVDDTGNVYFTTNWQAFKVNLAGRIFRIAGTGSLTHSGDGGPATAASFEQLYGIAVDQSGNVYLPDPFHCVVRKIDTAGIINTIAGTGVCGYSADGTMASAASLVSPMSVRVNPAGELLIGDFGNHQIRKINSVGAMATVAGNGLYMTRCLAIDGEIGRAAGMTFDKWGNFYMVDDFHLVRKINTADSIDIIAGTYFVSGFAGDGGAPLSAKFDNPKGVAVDNAGNIYVADRNNHRIRRISTTLGLQEQQVGRTFSMYPNPVNDILRLQCPDEGCEIEIFDVMGTSVGNKVLSSRDGFISVGHLRAGLYILKVNSVVAGKFYKN